MDKIVITLPQTPDPADLALALELQQWCEEAGHSAPSLARLLQLIEKQRITPCGPDCKVVAQHAYPA